MKGRLPKSQSVKELGGNAGHRTTAAPAFDLPLIFGGPPEFLTPLARFEWDHVMQQLGATGVLREVDKAMLSAYCMSYARWQEAEAAIERDGMLLQEPVLNSRGEVKGQRIVKHPALSIAKDEKAAVRSFGALFGLDPTNRSRLDVPKSPLSPEEKMNRFLDGDDDAFKTN